MKTDLLDRKHQPLHLRPNDLSKISRELTALRMCVWDDSQVLPEHVLD